MPRCVIIILATALAVFAAEPSGHDAPTAPAAKPPAVSHDHRGPSRRPPTMSQRANLLWWASDEERNMRWPWWRWFARNPFANAASVIIGVADCPRTVYWARSPWTFAEHGGANYGYTIPDGGWLPLPFASWRGQRWEMMLGWKTSGALGATLRRARSPNATETP